MNPIFGYQASAELGTDSWKQLVTAAFTVAAEGGSLKDTFRSWEAEYQAETSQPVPGAWRSAKSVILGAIKWEVSLQEGKEPRGKTAVEKDIKASKEAGVLLSDEEVQAKLITLLYKAEEFGKLHGFKVTSTYSKEF